MFADNVQGLAGLGFVLVKIEQPVRTVDNFPVSVLPSDVGRTTSWRPDGKQRVVAPMAGKVMAAKARRKNTIISIHGLQMFMSPPCLAIR